MKRLDIIVEGQSERTFVTQMLAPYLENCGIIENYNVSPIVIRTNPNNRGGMSKYSHLKEEILKSLSSSNPDLVVSMMIDFFRLPSNVPHPSNLPNLCNDDIKADTIERCIAEDINDSRFTPYIQLHEFEAFLFASSEGFRYCYGASDKRTSYLYDIISEFENPEDINSTPEGATSKRILSIIKEYDKVVDGNLIVLQNGMEVILQKCHRFRRWIELIKLKLGGYHSNIRSW